MEKGVFSIRTGLGTLKLGPPLSIPDDVLIEGLQVYEECFEELWHNCYLCQISKLNSIGIMQGRLSPDPENKIQFFPKDTWQDEFHLAAQCGFEEIELTMDLDGWQDHPVMTENGRGRLRTLVASSGVKASILCCDLFMKAPFFGVDRSKI